MRNIKMLLLIAFAILSCKEKENSCCMPNPKCIVFKLKGDYINNVYVRLSDDKKRVTGFPSDRDYGGNPKHKPLKLHDGYFLDGGGNLSENSVFLNITLEQWQTRWSHITNDSVFNLILDTDPFLVFYRDESYIIRSKNDEGGFMDTTIINEIIDKGELDIKLKRVI
jgi:hypothetical protein